MKTLRLLIAASLVLVFSTVVLAETKDTPSGTIKLTTTKIAAAVGGSIGKGTLVYKGYEIPFEAAEFSVGEAGISRQKGVGFIYNLNNLEDFSGSYNVQTRGIAILAGRGYSRLKNEKGVVIELKNEKTGVLLGLAVGGGKFTLNPRVLGEVQAALNAPAKITAQQSVFFELGSAEISDAEKKKLYEIVNSVRKNLATEVVFTGYTDTTGTFEGNVKLSQDRANQVSTELRQIAKESGLNQLPPERIDVFGLGEAEGPKNTAKQASRRVDIAVYSSPRSRKNVN